MRRTDGVDVVQSFVVHLEKLKHLNPAKKEYLFLFKTLSDFTNSINHYNNTCLKKFHQIFELVYIV